MVNWSLTHVPRWKVSQEKVDTIKGYHMVCFTI